MLAVVDERPPYQLSLIGQVAIYQDLALRYTWWPDAGCGWGEKFVEVVVERLVVEVPEAGRLVRVFDRIEHVGGGRKPIERRKAAQKAAVRHRVLEVERAIERREKANYRHEQGRIPAGAAHGYRWCRSDQTGRAPARRDPGRNR